MMLLPRTDPLRERFFTHRRKVGLYAVGVSAVVLGLYVLLVGPRIVRWLELMEQGNWKNYVRVYDNAAFVMRCMGNKPCRAAGLEFFNDDLNLYASILAFYALACFGVGVWMVWPHDLGLYRARFAKLRDVAKFIVNPKQEYVFVYIKLGGKWLGTRYNKFKRLLLDHCLVMAPTGSGKSVHAKTVLGTFTGSMIVVDIKGELYKDSAEYRQDITDVYRLNLTKPTTRYNPLADIGTDELDLRAAAALLVTDPQDHDPIFAERAVSAVRAALVGAHLQNKAAIPYLAELVQLGPIGFIETLTALHDDEVTKNLTTFLGKPPGEFLVNGEEIFEESKGFLPSAWGTLVTRLEPFTTRAVLELFSGNDFTAKELLQTETTVYLTFHERHLKSSPRVIALILEGLLSGMTRYADDNGGMGEVPCLVMLDEAPQYRFNALPSYISTLRSRGIALLLYIQDEAQLKTGYQDDAQTITSNCIVKMYYSPADETAKNLSAAFGYRDVKRRSKSRHNTGTSTNESDSKRELMTADEISKIGKEEAFLRVLGYHPVRGQRAMWYEEPFIKRRLERAVEG